MKAKRVIKKIAAIVCCVGCLCGNYTDVYGKETFETSLFSEETTEIEVPQEMKDGITACMETENGEVQPLDCDISLVKHTSKARATAEDMYTLEVKSSDQKVSSDNKSDAGISLLGRITWIDHPGTENELVSYYGLYSNPSKIDFAKFDVGLANKTEHSIIMNLAQKNSFYYTDSCHNKGFSFFLYLYARTKEDKKVRLTIRTSILD